MSETGTHQNARRIAAALAELARHPVEGARLTDVSLATGLGKGTVHRLLAGVLETGLADDPRAQLILAEVYPSIVAPMPLPGRPCCRLGNPRPRSPAGSALPPPRAPSAQQMDITIS